MDHSAPEEHDYTDKGEEIQAFQQWDPTRVKEKIGKVKHRIQEIESQLPKAGLYGKRVLLQTLNELEREMEELSREITQNEEPIV